MIPTRGSASEVFSSPLPQPGRARRRARHILFINRRYPHCRLGHQDSLSCKWPIIPPRRSSISWRNLARSGRIPQCTIVLCPGALILIVPRCSRTSSISPHRTVVLLAPSQKVWTTWLLSTTILPGNPMVRKYTTPAQKSRPVANGSRCPPERSRKRLPRDASPASIISHEQVAICEGVNSILPFSSSVA